MDHLLVIWIKRIHGEMDVREPWGYVIRKRRNHRDELFLVFI